MWEIIRKKVEKKMKTIIMPLYKSMAAAFWVAHTVMITSFKKRALKKYRKGRESV